MTDTVGTGNKSRQKHRRIDVEATLAKYTNRIQLLPDDAFVELEDAWLSTFKVYNTLPYPCDAVPARMVCNATILAEEALRRGINVHGVTSQRKKAGKFLCSTLPKDGIEVDREECKIIYVGAYSYFTGDSAHPVFSLSKADKVRIIET